MTIFYLKIMVPWGDDDDSADKVEVCSNMLMNQMVLRVREARTFGC